MEFKKLGRTELVYRENEENEEEYEVGFYFYKGWHKLGDFLRCHNNPWGNMDVPEYIHGVDATEHYFPLFISLIGDEFVDVYRHIPEDI